MQLILMNIGSMAFFEMPLQDRMLYSKVSLSFLFDVGVNAGHFRSN